LAYGPQKLAIFGVFARFFLKFDPIFGENHAFFEGFFHPELSRLPPKSP
jgi:hypothetical protein